MLRAKRLAAFFFFCISLAPESDAKRYIISGPEELTALFYKTRILIENSYSDLGIEVRWLSLPAKRSLLTTNAGNADAEFLRVYGIEEYAPNLVRVNVPLTVKSASVYGRKDMIYEGTESLASLKMVGVLGKKAYSMISEKLGADLHLALSEILALRMISVGHADFTILFDQEADQLVSEARVRSSVVRVDHFMDVELFHYLHKKHLSLVPSLEQLFRARLDDTSRDYSLPP